MSLKVQPVEPKSEWTLSMDLGKRRDQAVMAAFERRTVGSGEYTVRPDKTHVEKPRERVIIKSLRSIPLGVDYTDLVAYVQDRVMQPPFGDGEKMLPSSWVAADTTGNESAGDMFAAALGSSRFIRVNFSGGEQANHLGGNRWSVPTVQLVNGLLVKLRAGILEVAEGLPELAELEEEALHIRRRITATGRVSVAAETGHHDDRIMCLGVGTWWSTRKHGSTRTVKLTGW
jgi:hypothetical protein